MAKLMVMIEIPNYDYDELREMMLKKQEAVIPGLNFCCVKSKGGNKQVQVGKRYLEPMTEGNWIFFELIGVRP